jgi:uncharacterized protein
VDRDSDSRTATFRFYAELNDFLPPARRGRDFDHRFRGHPAIKDTIESLGVPHPEVDLILVSGRSVGFEHRLQEGERVAVYPVFEGLDISSAVRLRERPLRCTRFIVDRHLGKLARGLRLLGFDTLHDLDRTDREIIATARGEGRIILTRNRGLLRVREVTHGFWIRSQDPRAQVREVVERLDLASQARPFRRCLACNGEIGPAGADGIRDRVPPEARGRFDEFRACASCGRVYWKGSHYEAMLARVRAVLPPGIG